MMLATTSEDRKVGKITTNVVFTRSDGEIAKLNINDSNSNIKTTIYDNNSYSILYEVNRINSGFSAYNKIMERNYRRNVDSVEITNEIIENLNKLLKISNLPNNWNENGATAFDSAFINTIRDIIVSGLIKQPEIFPTACGSIQFEYDTDNDRYLEIEIFPNGKSQVFVMDADENEYVLDIDTSISSINKIIGEFYG